MGPSTVRWGLLSQDRLDRAKRWFDRNLILAVVLSRFMPGTRLPTYVGAGIFQASPTRFLGAAIAASLVWTFTLLTVTVKLGQTVLPILGAYRWPVVLCLIALIAYLQRRASKHIASADVPMAEPVVSVFEFWARGRFLHTGWIVLRVAGTTLSGHDVADRGESVNLFRRADSRIEVSDSFSGSRITAKVDSGFLHVHASGQGRDN